MAAQVVQRAIHWRDRAIARSEVISDAWQVFLAYAGRAAEIILFICMGVSLIEMIPTITLPDLFTAAVFVVQMITLDVAGFGLNSLAKAVRRAGDEETARKAETIGTCLIIIMVVSMFSGGIDRLFGVKYPAVKEYTGYLDDVLLLIRVVMTVFYGKIMHSLRDSQQHMQAVVDETGERLREEVAQLRQTLETERKTASAEKAKLQADLTTVKSNQTSTINDLHSQLSQVQSDLDVAQRTLSATGEEQSSTIVNLQNHVSQLTSQSQQKQRDLERLSADLQTAKATMFRLQNVESEAAKLQTDRQQLSASLETANLQIADLTAKLERAKNKIADLQNAGNASATTAKNRTAKDNITPIEQARSKNKMSHAEVAAFMSSHPDLKRAEVAAQLQISERKVYDAVAWQREQEQENAVVSQ